MRQIIWQYIATFLARPTVTAWLILRALRTPYTHIYKTVDGVKTIYMQRFWLFNPYPASGEAKRRGWGWLPSVRIHHICQPDTDRHHHDHPWNARTIVLAGGYNEQREHRHYCRRAGDTAPLNYGEYHQIVKVCDGGAWTLFITWKYCGDWGFWVDGKKVLWREYLGITDQAAP